MATLSDLKEMKEALDAGLVSQAEFDEVKRDYLRAKKKALEAKEEAFEVEKEKFEVEKQELRAKKEALEANKEFQKKELRAKEEALEFQKRELIAKNEALEANKKFQKRELRTKEDFQKKELIAKEAFQQRKDEADLRAYALESIVKHGASIMSEEQKADLVRGYAKMSGLDRGAENDERASKRQRTLPEEADASPLQPPSPPTPVAVPSPADAPPPADEDEYVNYSDDDGEDDSDSDEPRTAKRVCKKWTEEEDAALVAALRAGQGVLNIKIPGRGRQGAKNRLYKARVRGLGTPVLREYLEETCPEYVYKGPSRRPRPNAWSEEEDQIFIQAHKEGKTHSEITAILPGRSYNAVTGRWREAKIGRRCSAVLKAYAAECCKDE